MGFVVRLEGELLTVRLTGWDSLANLRRRLAVDGTKILGVTVERRSNLECRIDHRALGIGTHMGERRPNRRRVGTMMGRQVPGKQFWAVPPSDGSRLLLVVDLSADSDYRRLVLAVDDPEAVAAALEGSPQSWA